MSNSKALDKKNFWFKILNGTVVSVCSTLILILLFALIIRFTNIGDSWIFPINQIIKIASLFIGTLVALKGMREKGLIKGLIIGFAYYILNIITFSILQGGFALTVSNIFDFILTTMMGGLIGLIVVHIGK